MAVTLPTFTKTMDNAFVTTWYEIQKEAIDNILNATVLWAALTGAGCLTPQEGGDTITRTIKYAVPTAQAIQKGDTMPSGETEMETMAIWTQRACAAHVQRNLFDDQKNRGKLKIKDYVGMRIQGARDSLEQLYETNLTQAIVTDESGKLMQGLHDLVPPIASRSTGTYGGIARPSAFSDTGNGVFAPTVGTGNYFWGAKYLPGVLATVEDELLTDMKKLYNTIHANQAAPNLIVTTQSLFETYEEFALDISQIVKGQGGLADLGFDVIMFKGKPMIWTANWTANHMCMFNTDYIEIVYDPGMWFEMTDWKPVPLGQDRIAHIVSFANMIGTQPRRHGRLEYA